MYMDMEEQLYIVQKNTLKEAKKGSAGEIDSEEPSEIFSNQDVKHDQLANENKNNSKIHI